MVKIETSPHFQMLPHKVQEAMVKLSDKEGDNFKAANVLSRIRIVTQLGIHFSDNPFESLRELGMVFENGLLYLDIPLFSRVILIPKNTLYKSLLREGCKEQTSQRLSLKCFSLPEQSNEVGAIFNLLKSSKFTGSLSTYQPNMPPNQRVTQSFLYTSFEFRRKTTNLPQSGNSTFLPKQMNTIEFNNFDPYSFSTGLQQVPVNCSEKTHRTLVISADGINRLSTVELKNDFDQYSPMFIEPSKVTPIHSPLKFSTDELERSFDDKLKI